MTTSEERLKVLQMLKDNKITVEEAADLLNALDRNEPSATSHEQPVQNLPRGRWMHITVTDKLTGKTKVNARLPLGVVDAGLKLGAKFSPELNEMDVSKLMDAIRQGEAGKVIDVDDSHDHPHVEIHIE